MPSIEAIARFGWPSRISAEGKDADSAIGLAALSQTKAREIIQLVFAKNAEINADNNLTADGKASARRQYGLDTLKRMAPLDRPIASLQSRKAALERTMRLAPADTDNPATVLR